MRTRPGLCVMKLLLLPVPSRQGVGVPTPTGPSVGKPGMVAQRWLLIRPIYGPNTPRRDDWLPK